MKCGKSIYNKKQKSKKPAALFRFEKEPFKNTKNFAHYRSFCVDTHNLRH